MLERQEEIDREGARPRADLNERDGAHPIPGLDDVVRRARPTIGKLRQHLVQVLVVRRREKVVRGAAVVGLV